MTRHFDIRTPIICKFEQFLTTKYYCSSSTVIVIQSHFKNKTSTQITKDLHVVCPLRSVKVKFPDNFRKIFWSASFVLWRKSLNLPEEMWDYALNLTWIYLQMYSTTWTVQMRTKRYYSHKSTYFSNNTCSFRLFCTVKFGVQTLDCQIESH